VILDTCALLFLANGDRRLSSGVRERLARAPARWYCAISAFEVALKVRQGKLSLPLAPLAWVREVELRYALAEIPMDVECCAAVAALPDHHRDPFDRFVIAVALAMQVPVVTIDPKFAPYGVEVLS
jgi:PIN domain nuclease of toxin-antitoxin system